MRQLRAVWRIARLTVATSALYLALLIGQLLLVFAPRARRRWRRIIVRNWGRALCSALALRVDSAGPRPPPGSFLVCNHLSYLDIPVIASQIDTCFVSKSEVGDWLLIGRLARAGGTIFVERARKRQLHAVNDEIAQALERGEGVVVFPEGTSTSGERILPFRPALLAPAADAGLDVYSACLSYATDLGDPPASVSVCWWGDMALTPHVLKMLQLRRISAHLEFVPGCVRDVDRKRLAEKLWQAVNARFRPLP